MGEDRRQKTEGKNKIEYPISVPQSRDPARRENIQLKKERL